MKPRAQRSAGAWRSYSHELQRRWEAACDRADWDRAMALARAMVLAEIKARRLERVQ